MGSTTWRNWSVLLLASAALVGCNNTSPRDKSLGAGPKVGDQPGLARNTNPNANPFPTVPPPGAKPNGGQPNANGFGNSPGANPLLTGGNGGNGNLTPNGNKDIFAPAGGGPMRPDLPMNISNPNGPGNASPQPYPPGPSGGIIPPPNPGAFASDPTRTVDPASKGPIIPAAPAGFQR